MITSNLWLGGVNSISWISATYVVANAAFDKANSANALAYNTGIGANGYAVTVGAASNTWANTVGSSGNNYAGAMVNTAASSANAYAGAMANASNANTQTGLVSANNYAGSMANASNAWANTFLSNTSGAVFAGDLIITGNTSIHGNTFFVDSINNRVGINTKTPAASLSVVANGITQIALTEGLLDVEGSANSTIQMNIRNANTGIGASSDVIATADNGTDNNNFIDMGINGSQYFQPNSWTINGAGDGYLYTSDGALAIGTANTTVYKPLVLFAGGVLSSNEAMRIIPYAGGINVAIGKTIANYMLDVAGTINAANILVNGSPIKATGGNSFSTIQVSGQTNVIAATSNSVLNLATDGSINITTNATSNTINFAMASIIDYGLVTGAVTATNDYGSLF